MNTAEKKNALIGAIVLGLIILGLAVWYMASNPPKPVPFGQVPPPEQQTPAAYEKKVLTSEGEYHTADAAYPAETPLRATAGVEADQAAVSLMRSFGEEQIDTFLERSALDTLSEEDIAMFGLDQGRKYTISIDFEVSESPRTISYVYTIYEDTLGAHPNGTYRTFTFNKETGALVTLDDLFTGNYLIRLSEISRAELPGIISAKTQTEADVEYIESGTAPTAENFQNFALQGDTFVLIFPPYQVGPYALGTQFVEVPMSELSDILAPAYQ